MSFSRTRERTRERTQLAAVCLALSCVMPAPAWQPAPDPSPVVITHPGGSYLGVGVVELTPERVKSLGMREEHGVEITRVEDDSPAGKAGLKAGDVVLEYNGGRVEGVQQFMRLVRETPPGREVILALQRSGASQQVTVRTEARKLWAGLRTSDSSFEIPRMNLPPIAVPDIPRAFMTWSSSFLGIEGEALDDQLAQFFGVQEGVLVRSIVKGSPADKAGLRAGDVIVKVDDGKVATPREVTAAFRSARSKKSMTVVAVRDKREMSFTVPLEDNPQTR
ncbi:MAG: PDZ domain-containing protein [Bryobacteraceae bacterium]|nr:PDZ domain-containing protein [Bryobacteraceae bacterium]